MFYPRSRHGIMGRHYQQLTVAFMRRALGMGHHSETAKKTGTGPPN
jgi:hypothetical protein